MEQTQFGKLIEGDAGRDAIHVACYPAVAAETMYPGNWVAVKSGVASRERADKAVGIVDPFLTESVYEGQKFWVFLKPNTVTGLRHAWTAPGFPDETPAEVNAAIVAYLEAKKRATT